MALSEQEQKLLAQMEAALAAEDPKLVNSFRGSATRKLRPRRAALAGVVFFVGLAALIGGLALQLVPISVLGFVIMAIAAVVGINAWQHVSSAPQPGEDEPAGPTPKPAGYSRDSFMDRMEERWRRRRDEDF